MDKDGKQEDYRGYIFADARQEFLRDLVFFLYKENILKDKKSQIEKQPEAIILRTQAAESFLKEFRKKSKSYKGIQRELGTFKNHFSYLTNNLIPIFCEHLQEKSIEELKEPGWKRVLKFTGPTDSLEQWTDHFNEYIKRVKKNLPPLKVCKQIHEEIKSKKALETQTEVLSFPPADIACNLPSELSQFEFTGLTRTKDLENIHELLKGKEPIRCLTLTGMGGIGKSRLAVEYAVEYASTYPDGHCWIKAGKDIILSQEEEDYEINYRISQILSFAKSFNIFIGKDSPSKGQLAEVWRQLKDKNILFVIDDIKSNRELREIIPSPNDQNKLTFLTTSRYTILGPVTRLYELKLPTLQDSLEQLKTLVDPNRVNKEIEVAKEILGKEVMDRLPLAIRLLGGYLTVMGETEKLINVLERLKVLRESWKPGKEGPIGDLALKDIAKYTNAQLGAGAIFDLTWNRLAPFTQITGKTLTCFPSSFVDWEILDQALEKSFIESEEYNCDQIARYAARAELVNHSLLSTTNQRDEPNGYTYHSLIKDFFRSKTNQKDRKEWLQFVEEEAIRKTVRKVPNLEWTTPNNVLNKYLRRMDLIEQAYLQPHLVEEDMVEDFFSSLACLYRRGGYFEKAISTIKSGVSHAKERFSVEHPFVAFFLHKLAEIYLVQGQYKKADSCCVESLDMWEKLIGGEDHILKANCLSSLGIACAKQAQHVRAEGFYLDALWMWERLLGKAINGDVANCMNNLAETYSVLNMDGKAKQFFNISLNMRKSLFGEDHPDIALSYNSMAWFYEQRERYDDAEICYENALDILTKVFGYQHPYVASSLSGIARVYYRCKQYETAESHSEAALRVRRTLLGKEHPDTAKNLSELGLICAEQGKYEKAECLYTDAISINRKLHSNGHPSIAALLNNMATLCNSQGRYRESEAFQKESLEMNKQLFGDKNRAVAVNLNNLAFFYEGQGRNDEAESFYRTDLRSLSIGCKPLEHESHKA